MTREETKELLLHILMTYEPKDQYGDYDDTEPYEQALTMAIEALSADAVSRDGVIAYMCDGRKCGGDCDNCGRTTDIEHAKNFTRISDSYFERLDSVAVVRCKDCVWSKEWNDNQIFCDRILMRLRETDFCSYGERREE